MLSYVGDPGGERLNQEKGIHGEKEEGEENTKGNKWGGGQN